MMMCLLLYALANLAVSIAQIQQASSSIPMCPCVQNGPTCQKYDRRYQAHDVEEAISAFPDLSLCRDQTKATSITTAAVSTFSALTTVDEDQSCTTDECTNCKDVMRAKLMDVGLMESKQTYPFLSRPTTSATCSKYRFSNPENAAKSISSSSSESQEEQNWRWKHRKPYGRYKRQDPDPNSSILGTRFTLSCTQKGIDADSSGQVSLCGSCWVWRRLPSNYTPQYVNELVCDTTSTSCLSGYATCSEGTRQIEVVRDDGGVPTTVALTAGSFCECKVQANSAIQSLVTGGGLPSAIPPIVSSIEQAFGGRRQ